MRPQPSRIVLLLLLLLSLLLLLPLAAEPLHAGTIERLGNLDPELAGRAGFAFDRFGTVLGAVGTGAGERLLVCLGGDRASLWTFGATPESAQAIGGACPRDNTIVRLDGDAGVPTFLFVAFPDEVWRTDGTRAGTYQLLPRSPLGGFQVTIVARGRTALLFFNDSFVSTDGTLAGTREVARFEGSFLGAEAIGDVVVFAAAGADYSTDLWRTDGTSAGTRRLAHIQDYSFIDPLVPSGDRVFVLLQGSLWVTDGSEAGTRRGIDSWYAYGIYPYGLRPIGYRGGIAFEAEESEAPPNGPPKLDIWWSDGTPRGTRRLARLPSNQLYSPERFRVLGSRLLFTVEAKLWTSDGTAAGTGPLTGCRGGCPQVYAVSGVELDGALLMRAGDDARGFELWRTDGTGRGTRMVREVCAGACGYIATDIVPWRDGVAYLAANGPFQETALWFSDGTARGTVRMAPAVGELISNDGTLVEAGGRLYQMLNTRETNWQLWTLDGTPAGTLPLTRQLGFARADGELVRTWPRPDGGVFVVSRTLLSSDGTRAGTREVAGADSLSLVGTIGDAGIAQRPTESGAIELLRVPADGGEPTVFAELPTGHWVMAAVPFRGGLALDVHCGCGFGEPDELWLTDGTTAGTTRRLTFPNVEASFAAVDGDVLYFVTSGSGAGGGSILWRSDGSEAGTVALAQRPGLGRQLVRAGEELFFVAAGRSFGPELWRTDGTPAGTRPYFEDDGGPHEPRDLFAFDGALFFAAADVDGEEDTRAVWRLDPSIRELTALGSFATVGGAWTFAAAGDRVFFNAAETAFGGSSLYVTDGTVGGTVRVAALSPPGDPIYPPLPAPVALGDQLLFTALDLDHGSEAWTSDGTVAGHALVRDLVPGPQGSLPSGWVAAGGRAFFGAGDGVRAAGLFLYDPARPACASDGERVCLAGRWEAAAAFPEIDDFFAGVATGVRTSIGPASVLFAHPSGEPRLVLRASTDAGGASVAAAGLTREWWIATVTDTTNGEARRYVSLPGVAVRFDDRAAFPSAKGMVRRANAAARPLVASMAGASSSALLQPATAPCSPAPTTACLLDGRFSVRGHRGNQPATLHSIDDELALIVWPATSSPAGDADPDAAVRIVPTTDGGHDVFFAALAPAQGAAVVRDRTGRRGVYSNVAGSLTLVDDPTTFAPP